MYSMLFGANHNKINLKLESLAQKDIDNSIDLTPQMDMKLQNDIVNVIQEYNLNTRTQYFVTKSSNYYNCHGLVFGSRRTCILNSETVHQVLDEDKYSETSDVKVGDVAVYWDSEKIIHHTGLVIQVEDYVKVWSKWGVMGEVVHWAHNCPYIKKLHLNIVYYERLEKYAKL